jgi:hypothetical protein
MDPRHTRSPTVTVTLGPPLRGGMAPAGERTNRPVRVRNGERPEVEQPCRDNRVQLIAPRRRAERRSSLDPANESARNGPTRGAKPMLGMQCYVSLIFRYFRSQVALIGRDHVQHSPASSIGFRMDRNRTASRGLTWNGVEASGGAARRNILRARCGAEIRNKTAPRPPSEWPRGERDAAR